MTDRELLEKAAKAAGIFLTPETLKATFPEWDWDESFEPYHIDGGMSGTVVVYSYSGKLSGTTRQEWSPLTDDGDALRLAVKLKIHIEWSFHGIQTPPQVQASPKGMGHLSDVQILGDDPYAATRRAIVRAAAAIGETL